MFVLGLASLTSGLAGCVVGDDPKPLSNMISAAAGPAIDYTIEAGQSFYIDQSYAIGNLTIKGKLFCKQDLLAPITITATSITLDGDGALLQCGTEDERFPGDIKFLLRDDGAAHAGHIHNGASLALTVTNGGTLRLFGNRQETFGWQRIRADVPAGSTTVSLEQPVSWRAGDAIVIGPTGFNFAEAEQRTVASVAADGRSVTVTQPFTYGHTAFTKEYTEGNRRAVLDERAEVANLSRNIGISTAGDEATLQDTKRGAGVVIQRYGNAFVDGVELSRGGQLGVLGAYPFHWHVAGDVPGQFLRNSSIHHTFQRCVTIHGTNYAEVTNNVCFDHLGHGFFFEQGNEVKNVMHHNLGMLSRRVEAGKGLLDSDMHSDQTVRFSAPSTFWVTNPDNDLVGNVASGSEGTGFWMAFSQGIRCGAGSNPYACDGPSAQNNVFPARTDTLRFSENVAHAAIVGITWDGAEDGEPSPLTLPQNPNGRKTVSTHYFHDLQIPTFDQLVVFKNAACGVYFRGEPATFTNMIAADNGRSLFFAYNQRVDNALVVGNSPGLTQADITFAQQLTPDVKLYSFAGALIYDGPFWLKDVHFADFQQRFATVPTAPLYNIGGANRSVNLVQHVTFAGNATSRVQLWGDRGWEDTPWTSAVRDDGSISGAPGLLVPDHPMNNSAGECSPVNPAAAANSLSCRYTWGVLNLFPSIFPAPYDANHIPVKFERIEQATGAIASSDPLAATALTNKSGMILGLRYRYRLSLSQPNVLPTQVRWLWQPETPAMSPIIEIDGVAGAGCHPNSATGQLPSLAALDSTTTTAYRYENGNLYMRLAPGYDVLACP